MRLSGSRSQMSRNRRGTLQGERTQQRLAGYKRRLEPRFDP